jgi:hypothetical protein
MKLFINTLLQVSNLNLSFSPNSQTTVTVEIVLVQTGTQSGQRKPDSTKSTQSVNQNSCLRCYFLLNIILCIYC